MHGHTNNTTVVVKWHSQGACAYVYVVGTVIGFQEKFSSATIFSFFFFFRSVPSRTCGQASRRAWKVARSLQIKNVCFWFVRLFHSFWNRKNILLKHFSFFRMYVWSQTHASVRRYQNYKGKTFICQSEISVVFRDCACRRKRENNFSRNWISKSKSWLDTNTTGIDCLATIWQCVFTITAYQPFKVIHPETTNIPNLAQRF